MVVAARVQPATVESRDTLLILIEFETAGNDTVTGGNGNDSIFGQRGDDDVSGGNTEQARDERDRFGTILSDGDDLVSGGLGNDNVNGGTGDDLLVGDDFTNTLRVNIDMAEVVHGIRVISDDNSGNPGVDGMAIAFGGTIVIPPVTLTAEEAISQGAAYTPRINTRSDLENGHELVLEDGTALKPALAIVPDIYNNADMASGNDTIVAGWGNDVAFGDNLSLHTQELTRFAEINAAFADLASELIRLINALVAYGLNVDIEDFLNGGGADFQAGRVIASGNDQIFGGLQHGNARPDEGIDTIIGDNGLITPTVSGEPIDEKLYEDQALELHAMLRGLEHVAADVTIFITNRDADLVAELGPDAAAVVDLQTLSMGNDFFDIDRDDGPDTAIGDDNVDGTGSVIGTTVLDADLRAEIEQALADQQAGIVDPYTFHALPQPPAANPSVSGVFDNDEFVADPNDRVIPGSAAAVIPGALDAADRPQE